MFITKKKHTKILKEMTELYAERHSKLTQELKEARDLKTILEKMSGITFNGQNVFYDLSSSMNISFSDEVAQYVDDLFGGKVIKQEANKAIIITKEGEVKTGLTKEKVDKGYKYKLIRE